MTIPLVRSWWRGVFAVLAVLPWTMGGLSAALLLASDAAGGTAGRVVLAAVAALSLLIVPVQAQTLRALLFRARITLDADALVIHDPVFLREAFRIEREHVAGADLLDWTDPAISFRAEYDATELSPFREPLNVVVRLRGDHGFGPARGRLRGTWIWLIRRSDRAPRFPEPGHRYRLVRFRAKAPADAVAAITAWATTVRGA